MAYLALARKWRPKAFSEVVGQAHVVQALSNALDTGRVHHAFLFTGTRGVGKTTLARIFAKSLNCEQGTSAEPCQQCSTCMSIDEGRFVDLIEVDAASRTKVEDTRELLENVQYAPTSGKFKVYLIDEVHMLSGHSFNALLKTLEEPPEHVKFLFATTDPQKMPVTVLSRCLQFNLRAMRPEQVENQLVKILTAENIAFDQAALKALAKAADGSMRDGLSLLDQAIAQSDDGVRSHAVDAMLGTIKAEHTSAILRALQDQSADQLMAAVSDMADNAVDFSTAIDDVLMQLYYVSLAQLNATALAATDADQNLVSELSSSLSPELVQLYYQIGLIGKRDMALAPSLRVGFEMTLLRMLAFEPSSSSMVTSGASSKLASAAASSTNTRSATPIEPTAGSSSSSPVKPQPETVGKVAPAQPDSTLASQPLPVEQPPSPAMPEAPTANTSRSDTPNGHAPAAAGELRSSGPSSPQSDQRPAQPTSVAITLAGNNEWGEMVEQSGLIGLPRELAMNCACERLNEDSVLLSLAPNLGQFLKEDRRLKVEEAISKLVDRPMRIQIEIEQSDKETPAECLKRLGQQQFEQTKQQIHQDPGVQALMSEFGATVNEDSIKPNDA